MMRRTGRPASRSRRRLGSGLSAESVAPEMYPGRGGASRERPVLALLPGEPPGRISTVNAGAVSFEATLAYRPGEERPDGLTIEALRLPGAKLCHLHSSDGPPGTHRLSCEIRALRAAHLTAALDVVLRRLTEHAALAEAVLETRAVRLAAPTAPPAVLVERLARHLWEAGLRVSFGPSWAPVPAGTGISVGTRGLDTALEGSLREHPAWCPTPRQPRGAWVDRRLSSR